MSHSDKDSIGDNYFPVASASASGRQRTAQACDKCRERKTKCSGEKPVCQRCTNRALICEYSHREPRLRGVVQTKSSSSKEGSISRALPKTNLSLGGSVYSQSHAFRKDQHVVQRIPKDYRPISAASRSYRQPPTYFDTKLRQLSESRSVHPPYWEDTRSPFGRGHSPSDLSFMHGLFQQQTPTTPYEVGGIDYDPYMTVPQPLITHDIRPESAQSSSSFSLEAQENARYSDGEFSHDFKVPSDCQPPLIPDGNSYHSSSKLDLSTPTHPFHALDHLNDSTSDARDMPTTNECNGQLFGKSRYGEEGTTSLNFPHSDKTLVVRGCW